MKIHPVRTISRKPSGRCSNSILVGSTASSTEKDASRSRSTGIPNARSTRGWQLHPVFHVYQHERHRGVLEALIPALRLRSTCDRKGPKSSVWTFAVDSLRDLEDQRPPVLRALLHSSSRLPTSGSFSIIVIAMRTEGAPHDGRIRAARPPCLHDEREWQAAQSNHRRDPDGILRDCTPGTLEPRSSRREDTVRSSWRHGESGRNDLTRAKALRTRFAE